MNFPDSPSIDDTFTLGTKTWKWNGDSWELVPGALIAADIPDLDTNKLTTGILPVPRGGTGIGAYTAGNYVRAATSSALEQRTPAQVLSDIGGVGAAHVHAASDITSGTFADARIAESNVTQYQSALSITLSQLSNATTVGRNLAGLTNPSAITFLRINADNTVSTLTDSAFRTAIGAGVGTVTSVAAGNGLTFTTITGTGTVTLGTPASVTLASTNSVAADSHTHAFAPGGTTAQYLRGDGSLATFPTVPTTLGSLTDVTITANSSGEILKWNGSAWINNTLAEAGIQPAGSYLTANQSITLSGDVSGTGTTSIASTIAAGAVTLAKMANVATGTVFYRKTAGTGAPEVQTLATLKTDLGLTGTNSGDQTITLTGDVTGSGAGSFAATVASGAITLAKMANIATNSLIGRSTAGTGVPEAISVGSGLALSAGVLSATGGTGTVTSVSVTTANGVSGSVATSTTTPAITITLGAITPTSVAASGTVTGSNLSGTNTGDQTTITGNAGSATILQTGRTIAISGPVTGTATSFNGSTNITIPVTAVDVGHANISGTLAVDHGGTGIASYTVGNYIYASGATTLAQRTPAQVRSDIGAGTGNGTVTSVSVTTANGVSGSVATSTTTPAITITLGAITPTSVAASGTVTGSNLSGTNTGDQTITLTGDVTGSGTGSFAATIAAGTVTLAKMANIATSSFIGRITAATGVPEALTVTQATSMLNVFTTSLKGLAPASGGGTTNFLRADGAWSAPPAGTVTSVSAGNGMNFTTITGSGAVTLGTPSTITGATTNSVTSTSHTHALTLASGDITGALGYTPWHAGNDGAGSGLDADTLDGAPGNYFVQGGSSNRSSGFPSDNANTASPSGFYEVTPSGTGAPSAAWHWIVNARHSNTGNEYGYQLANEISTNNLFIRGLTNGSWLSWNQIWHAGNQLSLGTTASAARDAIGLDIDNTAEFFRLNLRPDALASMTTDYPNAAVINVSYNYHNNNLIGASGSQGFFFSTDASFTWQYKNGSTWTQCMVFSPASTATDSILNVKGNLEDKSGNVRDIPQNTQNATYTFVMTDRGKHVIKTNTTAYAWTIPLNSTTAFPSGTAILVINDGTAGNVTITRASGVALLSGSTDANFSLLPGEARTLLKIATDRWRVL